MERHLASCEACREIADTMAPQGDAEVGLPAIDGDAYTLGTEVGRGGMGRVIDAETGEEIVIPNGAREAYLKVVAAWLSSIEERCRRLGISYLRVPTDAAVDHVIMRGLHEKQLIEHRTGGAR